MSIKAFSLVELMVVIAIVALLAAVSVPIYKDYMNRAKISTAVQALNALNTKAMILYDQGKLASGMTQLNIDGTTWNDNTNISYNYPPVTMAQLLFPGDGYINSNAWMFCVYVSGLNFSGYGGAGGAKSRICSKVVFQNGVFTTYCGVWDPNSAFEIPIEYLPNGCNVSSVSSF